MIFALELGALSSLDSPLIDSRRVTEPNVLEMVP